MTLSAHLHQTKPVKKNDKNIQQSFIIDKGRLRLLNSIKQKHNTHQAISGILKRQNEIIDNHIVVSTRAKVATIFH